ncbi:MAG: GntR family transcriptional regulator [Verrucomicrobiales bacterium]
MLPFSVQFRPGQPVYEQVIYAVHKALVTGQLQPGDPFPSVRQLSSELQINPNTAHKIVTLLKQDKLIVVEPGRGTFINRDHRPDAEGRTALLSEKVEALVVEALKLDLRREDVVRAVETTWDSLSENN